jgi:hypothetical protein
MCLLLTLEGSSVLHSQATHWWKSGAMLHKHAPSALYDDCVEGIYKLMHSDYHEPLNASWSERAGIRIAKPAYFILPEPIPQVCTGGLHHAASILWDLLCAAAYGVYRANYQH